MPGRLSRIKAALHPRLDPLLSWPDGWRARRALASIPDGDYHATVSVPYVAQFASPERIADYIHHGYDGTQDSRWAEFGADDPADYAFWAPRVCALAVLKMAVQAFFPERQPSLWELVQRGLAAQGYTVRAADGTWVDEGWYVHAQLKLARQFGLRAAPRGYVSPLSVCRHIHAGWLVAASVSPELGERDPDLRRYGGHLVLVYGFTWRAGRPVTYHLHNPSGRFPELQARAAIPAARFHACFAHRLIALRPATA